MTALHCQSLGGQVVYSIILNKLFLKPTSQITWKKQVLLLVFTDKTSSNAWKYRHSSDSSASPGLSWGVVIPLRRQDCRGVLLALQAIVARARDANVAGTAVACPTKGSVVVIWDFQSSLQ